MPGAVYLEGDGIELCAIGEGDLPFLRDAINDPAVRHFLPSRTPINLDDEREFYEDVIRDDASVNLPIRAGREPAGTIELRPADSVDGTAELGLLPDSSYRGEGYGTEAARPMTDYAFHERRLHRVTGSSAASVRVWETPGYRREATLRGAAFHDGTYVDQFAVLAGEWRGRGGEG